MEKKFRILDCGLLTVYCLPLTAFSGLVQSKFFQKNQLKFRLASFWWDPCDRFLETFAVRLVFVVMVKFCKKANSNELVVSPSP